MNVNLKKDANINVRNYDVDGTCNALGEPVMSLYRVEEDRTTRQEWGKRLLNLKVIAFMIYLHPKILRLLCRSSFVVIAATSSNYCFKLSCFCRAMTLNPFPE